MGEFDLNTSITSESEDTLMIDDSLDDNFLDIINNDKIYNESKMKKSEYGEPLYCKCHCEFYFQCMLNTAACVKSAFARVLETLAPREEYVIRSLYGIDYEHNESIDDIAKKFNITHERITKIHNKALRKLKYPSRSNVLRSIDMCLILLSCGETNYLDFWKRVFAITDSREALYLDFLEKAINKRKLELAKISQEIDKLKRQKKKAESQLNITCETTITECCFGDKYDGGSIECETPVGELRNWSGEDVFKLCNYNKKIFEEVVNILHSHNISFKDYPSGYSVKRYLDKVYNAHSVKLRKNVMDLTIEELDFSVRTLNCLKHAGIDTVGDLIFRTEDEIIEIQNMSQMSLKEIKTKLDSFGLCLLKSEILPQNIPHNRFEGIRNGIMEITMEELDLSVPTFGYLKRAGIDTVKDLTEKIEDIEDMFRVRNCGRKWLDEIIEKLNSLGVSLVEKEK